MCPEQIKRLFGILSSLGRRGAMTRLQRKDVDVALEKPNWINSENGEASEREKRRVEAKEGDNEQKRVGEKVH